MTPDPHPHLQFLSGLTSGAVTMVPPFDAGVLQDAGATQSLRSFFERLHKNRSIDAPHHAPRLSLDAAVWGGLIVHWACWSILDRSETNIAVPKTVQDGEPSQRNASDQWSVDLIAAVWPQVMQRCKSTSADDPLQNSLTDICLRWPLTSIGAGITEAMFRDKIQTSRPWTAILKDPCLSQIARDRAARSKEPFYFSPETETPPLAQ